MGSEIRPETTMAKLRVSQARASGAGVSFNSWNLRLGEKGRSSSAGERLLQSKRRRGVLLPAH